MRARQSSTMAMWVQRAFSLPYYLILSWELYQTVSRVYILSHTFQEWTSGARVNTQYLYYANAGAHKTIRCL